MQLGFSGDCCYELLASAEGAICAIHDEDDLDFWSGLENVSKDKIGKVLESGKTVLSVFDCFEVLRSLYEHWASVND